VTIQNGNLKETSMKILKKYGIENEKVFKILSDDENDVSAEKDDILSSHVHNVLIGNNQIALKSAEKSAQVTFQSYVYVFIFDWFQKTILSSWKDSL
jgi:glycerate-2-kinase